MTTIASKEPADAEWPASPPSYTAAATVTDGMVHLCTDLLSKFAADTAGAIGAAPSTMPEIHSMDEFLKFLYTAEDRPDGTIPAFTTDANTLDEILSVMVTHASELDDPLYLHHIFDQGRVTMVELAILELLVDSKPRCRDLLVDHYMNEILSMCPEFLVDTLYEDVAGPDAPQRPLRLATREKVFWTLRILGGHTELLHRLQYGKET